MVHCPAHEDSKPSLCITLEGDKILMHCHAGCGVDEVLAAIGLTKKDWLEPDGLLLLAAWCRDGLTDEQIAINCGIGVRTLYEWKAKYPQVSQALKEGKEIVDVRVENALLRRALGYRYDEVTQEVQINPETGQSALAVKKVVTKEVQPETAAAFIWLKNRRPEQWRDKPAEDEESAASNVRVSYNYEDDSDE